MADWRVVPEGFFPLEKIIEVEDLSSFRKLNKKYKIVFTNGFFDLLHPGHVFLLYQAKLWGDTLVVGLNSDDSAAKEDKFVLNKKKVSRVINSVETRAIMLTALFFVDYVTIFDEANPEDVIRKLKPDVLVKGKDWEGKDIAGADFVKSLGGQVVFIDSFFTGTTTEMIEKIGKMYL